MTQWSWVKHYPSTLSFLSIILSANTAGSLSTVVVVGTSTAALSCSLVSLDAEGGGWDGVTRKSRVLLSFTAHLFTGFLLPAAWDGIWLRVLLPALCLPQGAWDSLGTDVRVADVVSEASLCSISLSLWGRLRIAAECEALQAATFNEDEFLTFMWVLVEGPENLIGWGPTLHGKQPSTSV